jgi:hypothetical protein
MGEQKQIINNISLNTPHAPSNIVRDSATKLVLNAHSVDLELLKQLLKNEHSITLTPVIQNQQPGYVIKGVFFQGNFLQGMKLSESYTAEVIKKKDAYILKISGENFILLPKSKDDVHITSPHAQNDRTIEQFLKLIITKEDDLSESLSDIILKFIAKAEQKEGLKIFSKKLLNNLEYHSEKSNLQVNGEERKALEEVLRSMITILEKEKYILNETLLTDPALLKNFLSAHYNRSFDDTLKDTSDVIKKLMKVLFEKESSHFEKYEENQYGRFHETMDREGDSDDPKHEKNLVASNEKKVPRDKSLLSTAQHSLTSSDEEKQHIHFDDKYQFEDLSKILQREEIVHQLNPLLKQLGVPQAVIFPAVIGNKVREWQCITEYEVNQEQNNQLKILDEERKRSGKEGRYLKHSVSLTLPHLGSIDIVLTHNREKLFLTVFTEKNSVASFLSQRLESLEKSFTKRGFKEALVQAKKEDSERRQQSNSCSRVNQEMNKSLWLNELTKQERIA